MRLNITRPWFVQCPWYIFDYFVLGVCISSRDGYASLYFRLDELVRTKQKYKILKMSFDILCCKSWEQALISILWRPRD